MDLSKIPEPSEATSFGSLVRSARVARGMTLSQVADKMGYTLVYQSEIERGIKRPTRERVIALSDLLGLNSSETLEMVYPEMVRKVHLDEYLRHGRVLASRVVGEFPDNCLTDEEREAIFFFEQFGGNDER